MSTVCYVEPYSVYSSQKQGSAGAPRQIACRAVSQPPATAEADLCSPSYVSHGNSRAAIPTDCTTDFGGLYLGCIDTDCVTRRHFSAFLRTFTIISIAFQVLVIFQDRCTLFGAAKVSVYFSLNLRRSETVCCAIVRGICTDVLFGISQKF